jgi:hypothetical protein
VFDQRKNLLNAIIKRKARIEEINLILDQPMPKDISGVGRRRLIEEKLHLEQTVAELQAQDRRLAESSFQWGDLDRRLISPKTNELAEEMHERAKEGERKIAFETAKSLNSAGYLPRLFDFHEELVDEWAKRLYGAHRVAWEEQSRTVSPAFIRAIRDQPIAQLFAARKSSVKFGVASRAMRTGESVNEHAVAKWERSIDRLANRWRNKLEAEAVALEYRAARDPELGSAHSGTNLPLPPGEYEGHIPVSETLPHLTPIKSASKKPGRRPRLAPDFMDLAGRLWLVATHGGSHKVSIGQLQQIASNLDAQGYLPPAEYLEGRYAKELRVFNSRHSNSRVGAIKTWSELVRLEDKDHLRGMRRLLSRCAKKQSPPHPLSGN